MERQIKPRSVTTFVILLVSMMILMGGAVVAPALPSISEAYPDASEFVISLIITLPSLAMAILGIPLGMLADRVGKVKVLVVSLFIFALSGVTGFFLEDLTAILVSRFLVGAGIAGLTSTATALISEIFSGRDRMVVLSYQAAANGVGGLVLELSGGALAEISWRYPFLVYGIGFVLMLLVLVFIREPRRDTVRTGGSFGPERPDRKVLAVCYLSIFLAMCMMFALPTKLSYYLTESGGSPTMSGLILGLYGFTSAVFGLLYPRISARITPARMLSMGLLLFGIGYTMFLLEYSIVLTAVSAILVGMAMGTITPSVTNMLAAQSNPSNSGRLMGGYSVFLSLGQFVSSILLTGVIAFMGGYDGMFTFLGVVALVLCVLYLLIPRDLGKRKDIGA